MESLIQYSDKELFGLISQGQKLALIRLFRNYSPRLSDFAWGLTKSEVITDEIVQEVFMRIWFNREKLIIPDDPKSYIFHTAASVMYKFLRQLLVENRVVSIVRNESFYETNDVPANAQLYTLAADIQDAISSLPTNQRKVYELNRQQRLKITEIAEELSLSPNAVRGLLNTATESIHEYILSKGHSL